MLFGEEAASVLPPQPAPSPPATPREIADDLVGQLAESVHQVRDRVSVEVLQEAFQEQFGGSAEPNERGDNPVSSAWTTATEEQRREFVNTHWIWLREYYA